MKKSLPFGCFSPLFAGLKATWACIMDIETHGLETSNKLNNFKISIKLIDFNCIKKKKKKKKIRNKETDMRKRNLYAQKPEEK